MDDDWDQVILVTSMRREVNVVQLLENNDPRLKSFRIPSALDDAFAIRLEQAMRKNTYVRHVTIKIFDAIGQGLTRVGIQHLTNGICQLPQLEELQVISWEDYALHMADPYRQGLLLAAMEILYHEIASSPTLQKLDIMCIHEANVHSVCHILTQQQHSPLQSFAFSVRDDFSIDSARQLARAIRQSPRLQNVEIHGQEHWRMYGVIQSLLENSRLWNVLLGEGIVASTTIQKLSLQRGAFAMTDILPANLLTTRMSSSSSSLSNITKLQMNDNGLTNRSVQEFVQQWQQQPQFQELDFAQNNIGTNGVQFLLQAMTSTTTTTPCTLKTLNLRDNKHIGYAGLQSIGEALLLIHQVQLRQLDLRGCVFPSEPVAARDKAARALLHGVQRNVHIYCLNLQHNYFSTGVEEEMDFYCALNRHGRYLLSTNHGLASTVWCHVLAKCAKERRQQQQQQQQPQQQHGASLIYYFLIEQPGLVPARW